MKKNKHFIATPKLHSKDGETPWGRVDKAKGWPWPTRGSCQMSLGQWATHPHLFLNHSRGITPLTHRQHIWWLKSLSHTLSSRGDHPSLSFCRPHYWGTHTFGVEATQPWAVRWDNRSRRGFGCLSLVDSPVNPKSSICMPSRRSTLTLSMHPYSKLSFLSLLQTRTSRALIPSTKMSSWLSPSSYQISWCVGSVGSSSTRAIQLTSCIRKPSKDSRSHLTLSTFTQSTPWLCKREIRN